MIASLDNKTNKTNIMITETSPYTTQTSPEFTVDEFNLKAANMHHIIDIVENKLYSNKSLAVIREYACNGIDANIMSGNGHLPIKVTLPSRFEPKFKVRDYGFGLNHSEMVNVFCSYGESTKRNTNSAIGQLGIGSKSAFAYGSSFTVVSYQDGYKTIYTCMKDSPKNKLVNLGKFETDEMDGLEVIVNVKENDIAKFRTECFEFFKYWSKKPVFDGFEDIELERLNKPDEIILEGVGWKIVKPKKQDGYRSYADKPIALMGNIPYPIEWENVNGYDAFMTSRGGYDFASFIKGNSFIFEFAIGEVQMSPSRESLEYVDKTNHAIIERLKACLAQIAAVAQAKMDTATNLWEASLIYDELFGDYYSVMHNLKNAIKLTFNNKVVTGSNIDMGSHSAVWSYYTQRRNKGKFTRHEPSTYSKNYIECKANNMVLWMDVDGTQEKLHINKVLEHIKVTKGIIGIYILDFHNYTSTKDVVYADLGLNDSFVGKYSDYLKVITDGIAADKVAAKLARQGLPVAARKPMSSLKVVKVLGAPAYRIDSSRELVSKEIDISLGGIYIETFANETLKESPYTLTGYGHVLQMLVKNNINPTVYVVGQDVVDTRTFKAANWVKFEDYINEKVTSLIANNPDLKTQMIFDMLSNDVVICNIITAKFFMENNISDELTTLCKLFTCKYQTSWSYLVYKFDDADVAAVKTFLDNIKKKYPLFNILSSWMASNPYEYKEQSTELLNYFKNPLDI